MASGIFDEPNIKTVGERECECKAWARAGAGLEGDGKDVRRR